MAICLAFYLATFAGLVINGFKIEVNYAPHVYFSEHLPIASLQLIGQVEDSAATRGSGAWKRWKTHLHVTLLGPALNICIQNSLKSTATFKLNNYTKVDGLKEGSIEKALLSFALQRLDTLGCENIDSIVSA